MIAKLDRLLLMVRGAGKVKRAIKNVVTTDPDIFVSSQSTVYRRPDGSFRIKTPNVTSTPGGGPHVRADSAGRLLAPTQGVEALTASRELLYLEVNSVEEVRASCLLNALVTESGDLLIGMDLSIRENMATQPQLNGRRDAVRVEMERRAVMITMIIQKTIKL
eukprot:405183-Amphidinium_carterae.1